MARGIVVAEATRLGAVRWRRLRETPDVIDRRGAGPVGGLPIGRGIKAGGGLGIAGLLVLVLIQLIGGGGGSAFDVDNQFDDGAQAPDAGAIRRGRTPIGT
jgi:predicted metalloprotease